MSFLEGLIGNAASTGQGIISSQREQDQRTTAAKDLATYNQELEMAKQKTLAEMKKVADVDAEQRGMTNRATEAQSNFDAKMKNAPTARASAVEDAKAAKLAEFDPEIQSLMRKAENEKLTSAEQAKLKFYQENRTAILGEKRDMARAGNIDNGAGLRSIQIEAAQIELDAKKAELKMPTAVKEQAATYREQVKAKTAIIDKLVGEGAAPDGIKVLDAQRDALNAKIESLYRPFMGDKVEAAKPTTVEPTVKYDAQGRAFVKGPDGNPMLQKDAEAASKKTGDAKQEAASNIPKPVVDRPPSKSTIPGAPSRDDSEKSAFESTIKPAIKSLGSDLESPEYAKFLKNKIRLNQTMTAGELVQAKKLNLL